MTSEPGAISAATSGKAAEDGSAGTTTSGGAQLRLALEGDARGRPRRAGSTSTLGAEMAQHPLGVVARRLALDHRGAPGALRPARSTADLICAEATGVAVDDRHRSRAARAA